MAYSFPGSLSVPIGTAFGGSTQSLAPGAMAQVQNGFGGLNSMQMAGLLGVGDFGSQLMGQQAAGASAQGALDTMAQLRDIDFGGDIFAANLDFFNQKEMPRRMSKFRVNNPYFRQEQLNKNLFDNTRLAGRFGAFVS
jgi:hypothetical protein